MGALDVSRSDVFYKFDVCGIVEDKGYRLPNVVANCRECAAVTVGAT